ncbi:MAG: DUF1524 domain-containing protein [Arthrobacter oryzae]
MQTGRSTTKIGAADWIARAVVGVLLFAATSCASAGIAPAAPAGGPEAAVSGASTAAPVRQAADAGQGLKALAGLPVKGRAPKTGYSRDEFGPAWADVDRNGCDTRNDMLRRDLAAIALKPGTRECVVISGVLNDPYTDRPINFLRGADTSTAVQIDHVVALSDAWQKGAQQLSAERRLAFANDPLNLLAVDGPANTAKSDSDAATWLPPNKSYRCEYVVRQISVKSSYGLWVTAAEHDAMARVLADCAEAPAPLASPVPAPAVSAYANCAAARAAGAAPVRAGQPGYSSSLDGDADGIACE